MNRHKPTAGELLSDASSSDDDGEVTDGDDLSLDGDAPPAPAVRDESSSDDEADGAKESVAAALWDLAHRKCLQPRALFGEWSLWSSSLRPAV